MRILLTGVTGYIGRRLLPVLLQEGHELVCPARNPDRIGLRESEREKTQALAVDFENDPSTYPQAPSCDAAYYLIHSMGSFEGDFAEREARAASHFRQWAESLGVKHVIYLSGITNADALSDHLQSRRAVEDVLREGSYSLTILRAGIVIGSGSASFEIIRDLVEKLPVMIAPKWLRTRCQPVGVSDVLAALSGVLDEPRTRNQVYDIGGPDVLSYRDMLLGFAEVRGLKRWIGTVPIMTPRLSAYWLYFVTATSFPLAMRLVDSMKVDVIAKDNRLFELLGITPLSYRQAVSRAFRRIAQDQVISSWKDALSSSRLTDDLHDHIQVPEHGCLHDRQRVEIHGEPGPVLDRIWSLGGETGWMFANGLWRIRGALDKLMGGIGLRRGRTSPTRLVAGDALDFWRVLLANKKEGRLLLYAEMKLPGDAWLEFNVKQEKSGTWYLEQHATFRPLGVWGRLYWYALVPIHLVLFRIMAQRIARGS